MPRVLPGGPALAVSADSKTVAVLDRGRLQVVDVADRSVAAELVLDASGDGELAFAGRTPRLITAVRGEGMTLLTALAVPELETIARVELPLPMRALAFVGERLLLADDDGDNARIVTLTTKLLIADPIQLRAAVHVAAAAPEDRLLVEGKGQLEFYDPIVKRPLFRLNLPMPPGPRFIGFTGRGRLLWVASRGPAGRVEVFRFSDGRRQLQVDLGGEIVGVEGSAVNNRLVVARQSVEGAAVELTHLNLGLRERQELTLEQTIGGFVVVEGDPPMIVTAAAGAPLSFVTLAKASGGARAVSLVPVTPPGGVDQPLLRSADPVDAASDAVPAPTPAASVAPTSAADRFAAWRSRLHGAPSAPPSGDASELGDEADEGDAPTAPAPVARPRVERRAAPPVRAASGGFADRIRAAARGGPSEPPALDGPTNPSDEESTDDASPGAETARPSAAEAAARLRRPPPRTEERAIPAAGASAPRGLAARLASARGRSEASAESAPIAAAPPSPPEVNAAAARPPAVVRPSQSAPIAPPAPLVPSVGTGPGWRGALASYARSWLAGASVAAPIDPTSRLVEVATRLELSPAATEGLALLYGGWLLGARDGLPAALVAEAIGDDAEWSEALGRGELARRGLARARRGRIRLRAVAGRLLDGQPPERITLRAAPREVASPPPLVTSVLVVSLEEAPETIAAGLAEALGRTVAAIDLDGAREPAPLRQALIDGLLEARAGGAVALFLWPRDERLEASLTDRAWLPDHDLLIAVEEEPPPALADLPPFALR